jgi:uncharacterized membrane protein
MQFFAILGGAVLGAFVFAMGSDRMALPGAVAGALIGGLLLALSRLKLRVSAIEQRLAGERAPAPVPAAVRKTKAEPAAVPPTTTAPLPGEPTVPRQAPIPAVEWKPDTPIFRTPAPAAESKVLNWLRDWFTGGNAIVRVGIVVLFFGVAFLLKYSVEHDMLPVEVRLIGAALGAIALLVAGWRLRERRTAYAVALQGGGIGILYLTIFAALRLYALIPPTATFAALAAMAVLSAVLAVLQNARALAVLGAAGGFLAPVLTSTGSGNHVALFSFYALLNAGIVGVAWYRAWRELNLLGFVFTFGIGGLWGWRNYTPEMFASTEPFLALFVLFFIAIAVLFALRQPPQLKGYVDGTLVFGVPIVGFGMQAALVEPYEYGLAWSALALGAVYIVLATLMFTLRRDTLRLLSEAFLALGVVFITLAIPLAFDGRWTSAAWAVEGAAVVWVSARQQRVLGRVFGAILVVAAGVRFALDWRWNWSHDLTPVLNGDFLGGLLVSVGALVASLHVMRARPDRRHWEYGIGVALLAWALLWWYGNGLHEIARHADNDHWTYALFVGFFGVSALLADIAGGGLAWRELRATALGVTPVGLLLALFGTVIEDHPFTHGGWLAWAVFLAGHHYILYRRRTEPSTGYLGFLHGSRVWLIAWLGAAELAWLAKEGIGTEGAWQAAAWAVVPALAMAVVTRLGSSARWPVGANASVYLSWGLVPVALLGAVWLALANGAHNGDATPLAYLPLLNPLDIGSAALLLAGAYWYSAFENTQSERDGREFRQVAVGVGGALAFLWLNAALLRTIHHWAGVPFDLDVMLDSMLVQASLSIFWSLLALALMFSATRYALRAPWVVGAALLGAVVVKLFLVDLSRTGTVARIVSFLVVGALLLLIGYFAPVPPKKTGEEKHS